MSRREDLEGAARLLAAAARSLDPKLAERTELLADRLAGGRFHVAVVGELKRGKSTLIDALVGAAVLPTGAVPVTTVATEVSYGTPGVTVRYRDGRVERHCAPDQIAAFVAEDRNPGNRLGVEAVEVRVGCEMLASGLVLVDAPGVNSIHGHHDLAAEAILETSDAAVVVLSADSPLSERERSILRILTEAGKRTFVVVNKVDRLDAVEAEAVRRFVSGALRKVAPDASLHMVAALPALRSKLADAPSAPEPGGFARFEADLRHFADVELAGARIDAARRELERLAGSARTSLAVSRAALEIGHEALAARVATFRSAAAAERSAFDDDLILLRRDLDVLERRLATNLAGFARHAPDRWQAGLEAAARDARPGELEMAMRQAVEWSVRSAFDSFRQEEADFADASWRSAAEACRARAQHRVRELRAVAADLFSIHLPDIAVVSVADEVDRFFYLFVYPGTSTESFGRLARRLLPARAVRSRLLERSRRQLADELDKHAGRARADLSERLEAAYQRFAAAMRAELDATIDSIVSAAERAEELRGGAAAELDAQRVAEAEIGAAVDAAFAACRDVPAA